MNGRGTLLIVDDTAESLRVLTEILQPEGYSVRPANSGKLALASIAVQPPNLILLDIRMPDLDGFEVCRRLKADEATRNIPVIFLSAATDLADRLEGLRLGAVDYISKPFQREELLARVKTHLELALLRGNLEVVVKDRTAQLELEIAEHQKAEERLTDNEARYRALFDGVPDALLVADIVTGIIRDVNQSTCRLFARTRDELVGVHQSTLHPPRLARETEQTFREYSHEAAEGKAGAPFEHVILRADGSEIPIEIRTQPVMLDGAQMMLGVFRDISERKRAEMVTRARLRMLEAVYAAGVSLEDTLRLMLDEIEAQTVSRIGFYHFLEEDQQTLSLQNWSTNTLSTICTAEGKGSHYPVVQAGVWADSVRERRAVIHNDYASLRNHKGVPDGHATIVRELTVPIFRGSRIVAIIGVGNKADDYTDNDVQTVSLLGDFSWEIVERKMAEEKLRCLNEELEQRVKERTSELAARNADLEKMNKVFVGRELKMVELKERIRELEGSSEKRGDQNARQ